MTYLLAGEYLNRQSAVFIINEGDANQLEIVATFPGMVVALGTKTQLVEGEIAVKDRDCAISCFCAHKNPPIL